MSDNGAVEGDESSSPVSNTCPTDAPVGILVIILGSAAFLMAMLLHDAFEAVLTPFYAMSSLPKQTTTYNGTTFVNSGQSDVSSVASIATLLAFVFAGLVFYSGIGIFKGRVWGFRLALVLFGLSAVLGGGQALLSLAVAVYCLLRSLAIIKPAPIPS